MSAPQSVQRTELSPPTDWGGLVRRVKAAEPDALEELYHLLCSGIRFFLCRQLGPTDLDDRVHDTFLTVVHALQTGDLREPERLMGFVRTIVRRQIAGYIHQAIQVRRDQVDVDAGVVVADRNATPEDAAIQIERKTLIFSVLRCLSYKDREILERFYLKEQTQEQICAEMKLTETQFRLLKSRAKAKFGDLGRKRLGKRASASEIS